MYASHIMVLLFLHPYLFSNKTSSPLTPQCQNTQSLVTSTAISVKEVFLPSSFHITSTEANKIRNCSDWISSMSYAWFSMVWSGSKFFLFL